MLSNIELLHMTCRQSEDPQTWQQKRADFKWYSVFMKNYFKTFFDTSLEITRLWIGQLETSYIYHSTKGVPRAHIQGVWLREVTANGVVGSRARFLGSKLSMKTILILVLHSEPKQTARNQEPNLHMFFYWSFRYSTYF